MHHTLLCSRERKRQVVAIETVEDVPHTVEHVAPVFAAIVAGVAQNVELHVEELFKLQSQTGTLHLIGILGIVNPAECLGAGDEMKTVEDEVGKRLRQLGREFLDERFGDFLYAP